MTMCDLYNPRIPAARPVPQAHTYAVALRQDGRPDNVELVKVEGTSLNVDPHWVRVMNDRDAVLVVPAALVRRITRLPRGGE